MNWFVFPLSDLSITSLSVQVLEFLCCPDDDSRHTERQQVKYTNLRLSRDLALARRSQQLPWCRQASASSSVSTSWHRNQTQRFLKHWRGRLLCALVVNVRQDHGLLGVQVLGALRLMLAAVFSFVYTS